MTTMIMETPRKQYKAVTTKGNYPYSFSVQQNLWEAQKATTV